MEDKRSDSKLSAAIDVSESKGLTAQPEIVPITEHSQEMSQPHHSKNYYADDLCNDEVELAPEQESHHQEMPERTLNNKLYYACYKICTHAVFGLIIILLIVANTVVLALDRHPIDQDEFEALGNALALTV